MEILILLGIVYLVGAPVALIVAFSSKSDIRELRHVLEQQRREIVALKARAAEPPVREAPQHQPVPVRAAQIAEPPQAVPVSPRRAPAEPLPPGQNPLQKMLEQFGRNAFVWIGGVALALAGFFLVKYSIETGILNEEVRCILGVAFGLVLLAGSQIVRARPALADGTRIAQALAGAGIAVLYGSLFAATTLYHLLPSWLGFGAMAATTAAALVLSLRHGAPIAALGLIGGYATPALIAGEPNTPVLFGYLYLVFAGLSGVIRDRKWWWLAIPATLVAFGWVALWLLSGAAAHDSGWLSLFLLAVGATAVVAEQRQPGFGAGEPRYWLRYLAPGGAVILMGIVAYTAQFGLFEWAMFGLFSLGAVGLAAFDGRTYAYVPWQAMAVNVVMVMGWEGADPATLALVVAGFGLLFALSGQAFLPRSVNPLSRAGLSAAAAVLYFLVAFDRLNWAAAHSDMLRGLVSPDAFWAGLAFLIAAGMSAAASRPFVLGSETGRRHRLQAIFAVAATSLVSIGLAIALHQQYLSFAIAVQIFALAWIATRVDVPALRILAQVLTAEFALLLIPEFARLLGNSFFGVTGANEAGHLVSVALFRFGFSATLLALASRLFRRQRDDAYVAALEMGAVALFAIMIHRLLGVLFLHETSDQALVNGAVFTNILLVLAIAVLRAARFAHRPPLVWAGLGLAGLALARTLFYGLLALNPLLAHQHVGLMPLFNGLAFVYALPALLGVLVARELARDGEPRPALAASILAYGLGFVWLTLAVRQLFNGPYLDGGGIGDAETYAYSAVWLAAGVALLFFAVLRKDMAMRIASLAVMLLTVGKVFLYDAAALTGLWRVVSFLGLGLSLLGLSWFYSRFVFADAEEAKR